MTRQDIPQPEHPEPPHTTHHHNPYERPPTLPGGAHMKDRFLRELAALRLPEAPSAEGPPVTEDDLAELPLVVRRYLRFMGVLGRPRDWSFRAGISGHFRRGLESTWEPMQAWQYNTRLDVARIFHMSLRFFGVVPVVGRDTYLHGHGRMLIRPLDLFTAQDATGDALDVGELVTYLNDALLLAPSMLLGPETTWRAVDEDSFDVSLVDQEHVVTARVLVDDRGAMRDFTTTDRFVEDPHHPGSGQFLRAEWSTPIDGWEVRDGRMLPVGGLAVWHLAEGNFAYVDVHFVPGSVEFNVPPHA